MAGSILVAVVFIAGNAWGPSITAQPLSSAAACQSAQKAISIQIAEMAKTNLNGGREINEKDGELILVAAGAAARQIARINCV